MSFIRECLKGITFSIPEGDEIEEAKGSITGWKDNSQEFSPAWGEPPLHPDPGFQRVSK